MSDFGDFDPEDAYDAGDPLDLRWRVIRRVADDLRAHRDDDGERFTARQRNILRIISNLRDDIESEELELAELADEMADL